MSKLIVLRDKNNKTICISETKYDVKRFILQNDYNKKDIDISIYKDNKSINKYLIKYDSLYLINYKGFMVREKDIKLIKELIYEKKRIIKDTKKGIFDIINCCNLSINEINVLHKSLDLLDKKSNKSNLLSFIDIGTIIKEFYNSNIFNNIYDLDYYYSYYIGKDD